MNECHEPPGELSDATRDIGRALCSLKEEIEAIEWYHQRASAATDPALRDILIHNRDEEMEHAAMALEWLRRTMPSMDRNLRRYLFTEEPIVELEDEGEAGGRPPDLGILAGGAR